MRRVEVLERAAAQLRPHDHVAWADKGPAGFARLVHHAVATAPDDIELMVVARLDDPEWDAPALFADQVESGRLQLRDADDMYRAVLGGDDLPAQLGAFDRELDAVLERGMSGLRVVADNTAMLTGTDADFERWVAWEQLTDGWQAVRPITGICYFDTSAVADERLAAVDALHPVSTRSGGFRLFHDATGSAVRLALAGTVDAWDVDGLVARVDTHLRATPDLERMLDLSRTEYAHHRLLFALRDAGVTVSAASGLVRRLELAVDGLH